MLFPCLLFFKLRFDGSVSQQLLLCASGGDLFIGGFSRSHLRKKVMLSYTTRRSPGAAGSEPRLLDGAAGGGGRGAVAPPAPHELSSSYKPPKKWEYALSLSLLPKQDWLKCHHELTSTPACFVVRQTF